MDARPLAVADPLAFPEPCAEPASQPRLRVGVLVDLAWDPHAGGHVKCWERLAAAAAGLPEALDLTVHFAGPMAEVRPLGDSVRYVIEPPVFSTARLGFLAQVPDHTDLSPWHPRLARLLPRYDVIHTTDAFFAYARTAMRVARQRDIPLVNSVHTNTPGLARLFTTQALDRLLGHGAAARGLVDRLRPGEAVERHMRRRLVDYQQSCAFAFVSRPAELASAQSALGEHAAILRRGVDRQFFHPLKRDRAWLAAAHGVPPERLVIFSAGRLHRGKNVLFLVEAVAALIARGIDAHLLLAGDGDLRDAIRRRLGPRVTCPGAVDPAHVARLHAAADVFALASRVEELANVTLEALASGRPVMIASESGMGRVVIDGETGFALPTDATRPWTDVLEQLARDVVRRRRMERAARAYAETHLPEWADVLKEDLLPRWRAAAGRDPGRP